MREKICIVGLGYVGLPTAINFAKSGFDVIGVDIDQSVVDALNSKKCHLKELNLQDDLEKVIESNRLTCTIDVTDAASKSNVILVIVPTPVDKAKIPDLRFIISATENIAKGINKGSLVIYESTVYPGCTEEVALPILEHISGLKAGKDLGIAYCPERYNPGDMEHTIDKVVRIVGGINDNWGKIAADLYRKVIKAEIIQVKDIKTAEAAKVIENIQRDLNIALMNELALIFERMDIDVMDVIEAASSKWNFLKFYPGPGVGGHCLPVDPYYLTYKAEELGYHPRIILAGRSVNDYMPKHVVNLVVDGLNEVGKPVKDSKISILGISYKSNTGDLRESPGKIIVEDLAKMGANIYIHDPYVSKDDCKRILGYENFSIQESLEKADCIIIVTGHDKFKLLDINEIVISASENVVLVDTQNFFGPVVKDLGLIYRGIGRK